MNANRLRAELAERGMTQGELAAAIGISPNSLSRKMNGHRDFMVSEAVAITNVLGLKEPQDIFLLDSSHLRNGKGGDEDERR